MRDYLVPPRDWIFVKCYGCFPFAKNFAKNMSKNVGKNVSKNLSVKNSKKIIDHAKQSATDAFKTASKRAIQKTADTTGGFLGNKIGVKFQNSCELYQRIIKKQLQMKKEILDLIEKYPGKDIYLKKKGRKLLTI